ncbi:MAG: twin-arginine translocase TatA/TatE family subunit [Clostridia bacterium]|nr:twin-arginine translocase TatA/TatE family subunit [Clostridia bacterium]
MFNIGMAELIVVLLVAFLIVGPKDLPKVAKWIARQVKTIRKFVREVKKETGWDDIAKEFKDTKEDIAQTFKDADVTKDIQGAAREIEKEIKDIKKDVEA